MYEFLKLALRFGLAAAAILALAAVCFGAPLLHRPEAALSLLGYGLVILLLGAGLWLLISAIICRSGLNASDSDCGTI